MKRPNRPIYERYEFDASPWVKNLTQRDLATLLGTTKERLEKLIDEKEEYITRREQEIGGKLRQLALPVRKLRGVHEHLKFHLNKIKQPPYFFSPRKGRAQRDNAIAHAAGPEILKLDIKQFYPSTTQEDIFRWAYYQAGMLEDVAGLIAKLVAIDGKMPFGSPISPVLTSLVHRPMFDGIYALCLAHGFVMSLWVDDLAISGANIPGTFVDAVRQIIRTGGFQTHKIQRRTTSRLTVITGVPISQGRVHAPSSVHQRVHAGYEALKTAQSDAERSDIIDRLLSALGTYRYHVGAATADGRAAANRMHALKQRKRKLAPTVSVTNQANLSLVSLPISSTLPWNA